MNGLFCFDGPIYLDKNGVYCNTTLTNKVFDRYLRVVDHLTIAIRIFNLDVDYREANLHKIELDNITFVNLPNLNSVRGIIIDRFKIRNTVDKLVQETDVIFARMPSIISNLFIKSAKRYHKEYLVEVGGCVWDAYWNHSLKGKIIAPILYIDTRRAIKDASYAVYVTTEFLQLRYPNINRTESCSNVLLPKFNEHILKDRMVRIVEKPENSPTIIGTAAAIDVAYKGQEYVIQAISKLNGEGHNFRYELVGVGNKSYLESIAIKFGVMDEVEFLGVMLHDDVIKWLDHIDIYSQPSKQEGLPRALVEAMSRACPSIGSTTAGIPELLQEQDLFRKGNVEEIYDILKDYSKERMIQAAKRNYEKSKEFDSKLIEERRIKIFKEYVGNIEMKIE